MDPAATFGDIGRRWLDGDRAGAAELARELLAWLDRGGFPPPGVRPALVVSYCRLVILEGATCYATA